MMDEQHHWLEHAPDAPAIKDSAQLGIALDMRIEAVKELAKQVKEDKLRKELARSIASELEELRRERRLSCFYLRDVGR